MPHFARTARVLFVAILAATAVAASAQSQLQNRSQSFAPGTCGPVDPNYIRVAEETGGTPLFFQRSEVTQATRFMLANTTQNHVTVLWAKGALQNSSQDLFVPVDSTLGNVMFTLSTDNHDTRMEVFGPTGASVASDAAADVIDFTCGRHVILKKPMAGSYRVHLTGSGRFWISVGGKSNIFLHGVEFVEPGGRPGHEGMFAIHGQPLAGKPAHLEANVSGSAKSVAFALVSPENEPIRSATLGIVHRDNDDVEFAGNFGLPNAPFRIMATGVDQNGYRFQRVHEGLVRPTSIALRLVKLPDLVPGKTVTFTYQATNLGNNDKLHLVAVCANGWPAHADRSEVSLKQGETATLHVSVDVPDGAKPYTSADLVLTATSEANAEISNGVVQHLSVESAGE